ncbi:hypothetical protein ABN09_11520, partial [Morganella morganii]
MCSQNDLSSDRVLIDPQGVPVYDALCNIKEKLMARLCSFSEQRQALIRTLLQSEGRVQCSTLVEQLGVSEHTIRRDL